MSAFAAGVRRLQSTEDFVEERKYSAAELERILKIQEVIAKAMAGKRTWWQAAEIMGVTDPTMRRWRARMRLAPPLLRMPPLPMRVLARTRVQV